MLGFVKDGLISAGDMMPADGLLLEANDLFIKQALLTGEAYPVEKHPGELPADATNAVFMGPWSSVVAANCWSSKPALPPQSEPSQTV